MNKKLNLLRSLRKLSDMEILPALAAAKVERAAADLNAEVGHVKRMATAAGRKRQAELGEIRFLARIKVETLETIAENKNLIPKSPSISI